MIVGSRNLSKMKRNLNDLSKYCLSLLPKEMRHNIRLLNNQKYYVALELRGMKEIEYETRKKLCEELLVGVYLTGDMSIIVDISDLVEFIDYNVLCYNLFLNKD